MRATLTISVPGGRWVQGVRHREVELTPLSAHDQVLLADADGPAGRSAAARFTWMLARTVVRVGTQEPVDADDVRELAVGDREALALHLCRLLVGERMSCPVFCPGCGEPLDVDLSVGQLLVPGYPAARPWYETTAEDSGVSYQVRFRLPTGRDQEEVGSFGYDAPAAAAEVILRRCVLELRCGGERTVPDLPPVFVDRLPGLMAELDPQAVTLLDMACMSCERPFVVPFSPSGYLVQELVDRSDRLIAEVHTLALHYHWSESAILALPAQRRRAYLDLLEQSAESSW
jgi:hypothetical protein